MATKTRTVTAKCQHHWTLPPPNGETAWGTCKKCGRRKRFSNRFDGHDRANNSDIFVNGGAWRPDHRASYYPAVAEAHAEARSTAI